MVIMKDQSCLSHYRHQWGYVFIRVCLLDWLLVSEITQKHYWHILINFTGNVHSGTRKKGIRFWGWSGTPTWVGGLNCLDRGLCCANASLVHGNKKNPSSLHEQKRIMKSVTPYEFYPFYLWLFSWRKEDVCFLLTGNQRSMLMWGVYATFICHQVFSTKHYSLTVK